ncbi:MAG: aminotransferase class IV [Gammaproteobacteria bacterium]|nr:aminotransferase class IV [Gammaproteobacteria bacterium]
MKVWYRNHIGDARECRISILDHGLLYGDGVFEGIRITGGRVFRLHDHIARLERSARAIGLELPLRGAALATAVLDTARANGEAEAYVRLVATRGVGELGVDPASCVEPELFCIVASLRMFPAEVRAKGLRLLTSWLRRPAADMLDPQVKSLNYLNNVLAKRDARLKGYDDALLLNSIGRVTEATGANLFAVIDGTLVTPPTADGALPGITRDSVLKMRAEMGAPVECRSLTRYDLLAADEVFLSGSGAGLVSVASIDDTPIGSDARPLCEQLRETYGDYAARHGVAF